MGDAKRVPEFIEAKAADGVVFILFAQGIDGVLTPCGHYQGDVLDIVEGVEARALSQTNAQQSPQVFELHAVMIKEGKESSIGTEVFRLNPETLPGGASMVTEPANMGGMMALLMRHTDAAVRTSVLAQDKVVRIQERMMSRLQDRAEHAEDAYLKTMRLTEELTSNQHSRDIELLDKTLGIEMKQLAAGKLMQMAPLLVDLIANKKDPDGSGAVTGMHLFKSLADSLRPDQLEHIIEGLDDEQKIKLAHLIKTRTPPAESESDKHKENVADGKASGKH